MKIIAIDSSGMIASVAVCEDNKVLAEYTVNHKKTHSQTLLPMLDEVKKMIELDLGSVEAIAVAGGPGSYTGLRIGSATAKGMALAMNVPIVNVPTLEAMVYNGWGFEGLLCPMMDARRTRVFTGIYRFKDGQIEVVEDQMAVEVSEIADKLNSYGENVLLLGDGATVYRALLEEKLTAAHMYAPMQMDGQRAACVAQCAFKFITEGRTETAEEHKPEYLSMSQAERERKEKQDADKKND